MVNVRKAKQEDKESIWNIHIQSIKGMCNNHYSQDELQTWIRLLKPERYEKSIESKTLFVAVDGDIIIGFGQLDQENSRIEDLYVRPDFAKRGVGVKILLALENVAKELGLRLLHLNSTLNAITFYEKAGYTSNRQVKYLLPNDRIGCIRMVKRF